MQGGHSRPKYQSEGEMAYLKTKFSQHLLTPSDCGWACSPLDVCLKPDSLPSNTAHACFCPQVTPPQESICSRHNEAKSAEVLSCTGTFTQALGAAAAQPSSTPWLFTGEDGV
ncbi:unnamed protein product [Caretta caretta]